VGESNPSIVLSASSLLKPKYGFGKTLILAISAFWFTALSLGAFAENENVMEGVLT